MRSILSLSEGQFHSPSGEYNGGALPSGVRLSGLRFFYSVEKVMSEAKENAIILLHDRYEASVEAALRIVDLLKEQGYTFVTADKLVLE